MVARSDQSKHPRWMAWTSTPTRRDMHSRSVITDYQDSVQEFRVTTTNYNADEGNDLPVHRSRW